VGLGCVLIAPGRRGQVVFATMGPSSLVHHCPAAASEYFSIPECCPNFMREGPGCHISTSDL
jgi:hypothetical protein